MTQPLPEPIPHRIDTLPRDARGFPVPWFVQWLDDGKPVLAGKGEPDFRVMDSDKFVKAMRVPICWICGTLMGKHRVFVIGPMCAINRTIGEPPSHRECAEWAVKACPFLSRPKMRRNEHDLPEHVPAAGHGLKRNPGVTCLWETMVYRWFKPTHGNAGWLVRLGEPTRVDWWCEGRTATRDEVAASILSGLPLLEEIAKEGGPDEMVALTKAHERVMPLLPVA